MADFVGWCADGDVCQSDVKTEGRRSMEQSAKKKDCPDAKERFPVEILKMSGWMICREMGITLSRSGMGFCFGMDAVLLAGFARVNPGNGLLIWGTGTGIIPILLEARYEGEHYTGLEIQEEVAEMARRSVRLNGLEDKVDIALDIKGGQCSVLVEHSLIMVTLNRLI